MQHDAVEYLDAPAGLYRLSFDPTTPKTKTQFSFANRGAYARY